MSFSKARVEVPVHGQKYLCTYKVGIKDSDPFGVSKRIIRERKRTIHSAYLLGIIDQLFLHQMVMPIGVGVFRFPSG